MPEEQKPETKKTEEEKPIEQKHEEEKPQEQLFDILLIPGVPQSIIVEIIQKFDVKLVERKERISIANIEGDERNLLAFRGKREVMEQVEKYMLQRLNDFVGK